MWADMVLATRTFGMADQQRFADFCGDVNPMHMDPMAARRTQAGAPVVHGMHLLLWALDTALAERDGPVAAVNARFERFLAVDTPVDLHVAEGRGGLKLELRSDGPRLTRITVALGEPDATPPPVPTDVRELAPSPVVLDLEGAGAAAGAFRIPNADPAAFGFARAAAVLGAPRVRGLAALSTLVGMATPGLHSILASVEARFAPAPAGEVEALAYRATSIHDAFNLVTLDASGPGLVAEVEAFLRPPPVRQPSLSELRGAVAPGACANVRALVVGGSRGLGEVAAKLIAAGGGRVAITYAAGRADAERVAGELRSQGALCELLPYDAREAAVPQLAALPFRPNQIYYFATPRIFRQRTRFYAPDLLAEYTRVYCDGLYDLCAAYAGGEPVRVFYPSSVAVEERPADLTEYAMAKSASEMLCADINRDLAGVSIVMQRLPRLDTDQTATLSPVEAASTVKVIGAVVARMAGA